MALRKLIEAGADVNQVEWFKRYSRYCDEEIGLKWDKMTADLVKLAQSKYCRLKPLFMYSHPFVITAVSKLEEADKIIRVMAENRKIENIELDVCDLFHLACSTKNIELVKAMLWSHPKEHQYRHQLLIKKDKYQMTPLSIAIRVQDLSMVHLLVKAYQECFNNKEDVCVEDFVHKETAPYRRYFNRPMTN